MDLVREYVRCLMQERVRPSKFNLDTFRNLEWPEMKEYLDAHLKRLGKGSSRIAYLYSSSYVIKFAFNDAGTQQNVEELDIFNDYDVKPILAKIKDYDEEARWSLSEIVRPLQNDAEFFTLLGMQRGENVGRSTIFDWGNTVEDVINTILEHDDLETFRRILGTVSQKTAVKLMAMWHALHNMGLEAGDLYIVDHWGKTATGELALLDYGFTTGVWEKFYKQTS